MPSIPHGLYAATAVAVIFYGSNFVPLRSVRITNYAFFQWIMCNTILITALPWCLTSVHNANIEPFAYIGGMSWCLGNYLSPFVIDRLGLGVGLMLWNTVEMSTAWLSSRFGILGVEKQTVDSPALNLAGIFLILIGGFVLSLVQFADDQVPDQQDHADSTKDMGTVTNTVHTSDQEAPSAPAWPPHTESVAVTPPTRTASSIAAFKLTAMTPKQEGILLALIAGFFFGVALNPMQYLVDQSDGKIDASSLVLSHYAGICYMSYLLYLGSTITALYHHGMDLRALLVPYRFESNIILPAVFAGALWVQLRSFGSLLLRDCHCR